MIEGATLFSILEPITEVIDKFVISTMYRYGANVMLLATILSALISSTKFRFSLTDFT